MFKKTHIYKIHQTEDIIVKADKSRNLYKMTAEDYEKLVQQNVTTEYKKAPNTKINKINKEAAEIARELDIDNRIDQYICFHYS